MRKRSMGEWVRRGEEEKGRRGEEEKGPDASAGQQVAADCDGYDFLNFYILHGSRRSSACAKSSGDSASSAAGATAGDDES
jgi:hypothetical protein